MAIEAENTSESWLKTLTGEEIFLLYRNKSEKHALVIPSQAMIIAPASGLGSKG